MSKQIRQTKSGKGAKALAAFLCVPFCTTKKKDKCIRFDNTLDKNQNKVLNKFVKYFYNKNGLFPVVRSKRQ